DSFTSGGRQHDNRDTRERIVRSCVVQEPAHAEKQHAREPGDLRSASVPTRSRPAREGTKPQCEHARFGGVGPLQDRETYHRVWRPKHPPPAPALASVRAKSSWDDLPEEEKKRVRAEISDHILPQPFSRDRG